MPLPDSDPIVVAPTPTPFDSDDRVDHDSLARNIERWLATPLSGFVLGTANGEELALSNQEKVDIVRTVAGAHAGARFVIAGIDVPSSAETLRLAEAYADAGADLVRVRIPRQMSPTEIESYFEAVIRQSPVPVIIIHQTFTGVPAADPKLIGELCARDNVFGYITDHDIRFEARVRLYVPESRRFWTCNGGLLLPGTLIGANGACMWLGNVAPTLCTEIVSLGRAGGFSEGRPLQRTATRLDASIGNHGVAGVKAALDLLGFEGMTPRRPRRRLDESDVGSIRATLEAAGLLG